MAVKRARAIWASLSACFARPAVDATAGPSLLRYIEVRREAERAIGERAWMLLTCYGKLMAGPHSGSYVSALAGEEQLELVRRLQSGETVPVHLMHRHRSEDYRTSSLRWTPTGLVMVFSDREVPA